MHHNIDRKVQSKEDKAIPLAYEIALEFRYEGSSRLHVLTSGRMTEFLEGYVEIVEG